MERENKGLPTSRQRREKDNQTLLAHQDYALAMMAPVAGNLVLFGGIGSNDQDLSDTWTWDGTTWKERAVAGPSARFGGAMATP